MIVKKEISGINGTKMARKFGKVWEGLQMISALQDGLQLGFENGFQVSVGNGLLEVSEPRGSGMLDSSPRKSSDFQGIGNQGFPLKPAGGFY